MKKRIYKLTVATLFIALATNLVGCNDNTEDDFNKGREIFISNKVAFNIVFPELNDVIVYNDSTSGFTGWVKDGKLSFTGINIKTDSIMLPEKEYIKGKSSAETPKKKYYFSLKFTLHNTMVNQETTGDRGFNSYGEAILTMDTIKNTQKQTNLIVSPIFGNIKGDNLSIYSDVLPNETQPYLTIRSIGKRIK